MAMAELTAGCHDSSTAALAHGGGEMFILEYFLKLFYIARRRSCEFSPWVLVEWNEVDLGPQTA